MQKHHRLIIAILVAVILAQLFVIIRQTEPKKKSPKEIEPNIDLTQYSDDPKENYVRAMDILYESGAEEAKSFLQPIFDSTGHSLYFFALAWLDYKAGDFDKAKKRADYLIITEKDDSEVKAYALHLLGYIHYLEGNSESSGEYFQRAEKLNLANKKFLEVFRNRMGLARCKAFENDFQEAKRIMRNAIDSTVSNELENLPYFYNLDAFIEFNLGNKEHALALQKKCVEMLAETKNRYDYFRSLLRICFYEISVGDLEAANQTMATIQSLASSEGFTDDLELKVVSFQLEKCSEKQPTIALNDLMDEVHSSGTPHQVKLFQDLPHWSCPSKENIK